MCRLTIHTATYNRGYILEQAYRSLKEQTVKDFEWIITDDGSADGTERMVSKWQEEDNGFDIVYNKLPHVGIPRALNSGVSKTRSPWFMMLDSDDRILPDTVRKVLGWLEEIEDLPLYAGIGFARCYPDGRYMKDQEPLIDPSVGYVDATHLERAKYNLDMDMCEVHRTELFRKFPFQYWETEAYAPEQLNFYEIAMRGYKLRWRAEKLYICEYLPDGQTKDNRLVKKNPMGFAMMYNQNLLFQKGIRTNLKNAMQVTALCYYSGNLSYLQKTNSKIYTALTFIPGLLLGVRRKRQFARL